MSAKYTQGNCNELADDVSHNLSSLQKALNMSLKPTALPQPLQDLLFLDRETGPYFEGGLATSSHKTYHSGFEQVHVFLCPVRWFRFISCFSSTVMLCCCTLAYSGLAYQTMQFIMNKLPRAFQNQSSCLQCIKSSWWKMVCV